MTSVKKNIGYQTVYQILATVLPLITAPYLSRVFGAENLGIFSYTTSVISYFTLFAMLGFINYGTRTIASKRSNIVDRDRTFWEIYSLQLITSLISITVYVLYLVFICRENRDIALIQSIAILACFLDVNWFFFGTEQFSLTVKRNIFVKLTSVTLILLFVRKPSDLPLYTMIMTGSTAISQIILWYYIPKNIKFYRIHFKDVIYHIRPVITLFVPIMAMSVYQIMDKTMLGVMSTRAESGYYFNADSIVNVPVNILIGFGMVLMPKISTLIFEEKHKEADQLFLTSMRGVILIGSALSLGIASVAKEFTPIFFGPGYEPCVTLIICFSPILIIKGYSDAIRSQYLIPNRLDHIYIYSVFIGAGVNLIFNPLLIPKMGALGAVIGTLFAEISSCTAQFIFVRKRINFWPALQKSFVYIFCGLIMAAIVRVVAGLIHPGIISLLIEILVGAFVYIMLAGLYTWFRDTELRRILFNR